MEITENTAVISSEIDEQKKEPLFRGSLDGHELSEELLNDELEKLEVQLSESKVSFFNSITLGSPQIFTWVLVAFASMGGLLSGLDQSLISGANLYMPADLHLDSGQVSLVDSLMPLGAVLGALILSPTNELLGRKLSIIVACLLYTLGAGLEAGAHSVGMMYAARFILGMGLGLEGGTVPVYVAECVARKFRGNLVSLYQFNIALGEVFGYVVAAIFVNVSGTWRWMLGSSLLFSTVLLIGMIFMPESPRYLMHKGREVESYSVWKRIRGVSDIDAKREFIVMRHLVEQEQEEKKRLRYPYLDFIRVPRCRRAIVFANIMVFLGQFTGVNAIMYYMSVLMSEVGFSAKKSVFMSLVGGGSLLLGTIPAILWMDRFGRRVAAITLLPGFFIGLLIIGFGYFIPLSNVHAAEAVYIAGLIIYMWFFGSYACLTWVLPSEVYPTYLRSYGMTSSDATLFLCAFIVTYNFTRMQNAMTKTGLAVGFYGGIAVLGWIYQLLFMPETKNKTLEEIDLVFSKPTKELVKENWQSAKETVSDLFHLRWKRAFGLEQNS
ncbi:hypothetical protein GAYE_PCTG36G0951 [Galdieria yellowstonensis]|uniref:Major facilitator superfamily (MFS) profile domain-containing protein n=1 Tax=Galdieria yellowstonensis TaxID=3028027 RepID=A0AAV9I3M9_9RHOD|nr:hypothetical protein GAYE_PCTG36G0951 [Galdieria yellowstonensis]